MTGGFCWKKFDSFLIEKIIIVVLLIAVVDINYMFQ